MRSLSKLNESIWPKICRELHAEVGEFTTRQILAKALEMPGLFLDESEHRSVNDFKYHNFPSYLELTGEKRGNADVMRYIGSNQNLEQFFNDQNTIDYYSKNIIHRVCKNTLVIGEAPNSSPRRATNDTTHKIKALMTLAGNANYSHVNITNKPGGKFKDCDIEAFEEWLYKNKWLGYNNKKKIIALGNEPTKVLKTIGVDEKLYLTIPHTSGSNRWWNDILNTVQTLIQLHRYLKKK